MRNALQVAKAIEILSKYNDISICAEHDELYLGVGLKDAVSSEDKIALEELDFLENGDNYWRKFV